jgi:hypothetical protein
MMAIRDKLGWALAMAVSLLLIGALAGVVRGGPLDPPSSPGSTQQNLIFQPATCAGFPITISQGSHKLAQSIVMPPGCAKDGIFVNGSNVTIDLQGFELIGAFGSSLDGIESSGHRLTVRNGTIRTWTEGYGINASVGLNAEGVTLVTNGITAGDDAIINNCHVEASRIRGITVGHRSIISNCRVWANSGGIHAGDYSIVTETVARENGGGGEIRAGIGSTLENCTADGRNLSFGKGIVVGDDSIVRGCTARNNGDIEILAGHRALLENCVADGAGSGGNGIQVGNGSVIRGCTASNNGNDEIVAGAASVVESCSADGAGTGGVGIFVGADGTVRGCTATNNAGNAEIDARDGSLVEDCVVDGFSGTAAGPGDGIVVFNDTTVRGCNSRFNGGSGVRVNGQLNRIEGNRSYSNGAGGFNVFGGGNVGIQNTAGFNSPGNYGINPGNQFEVINGTAGATNPFANIQ